jgi:pimeloyl-ACP methyl ester carboxylesterase
VSDQKRIVLLHGWGGSCAATWQKTGWTNRLTAAGYDVHCPNLLGHGVLTGPHDPQDYANIADELEAQLGDAVGLDGVGYSLGAKILLELACRRADRFRRLVLSAIGENAYKPLTASEAIASAMVDGLPEDAPPSLAKLVAYTKEAGNDPLAMAACMRRPQDRPITPERLSSVKIPVFIGNGDLDHFISPVEPLTDAMPKAEARLYAGIDHFDILEDPHFVSDTIEFLRR